MSEQETRSFRSTAGLVLAWLWMAFAAVNFVDIAVRGRDFASVVAAAVLLFGCGLAYVVGIRPKVSGDASGVRVRNPLRESDLPWPVVGSITITDAVRLTYRDAAGDDQVVRAWALPSSPRARAKAERRAKRDAAALPDAVAKELKGRTPATFAVEQLTELRATSDSAADGRPAVTAWSVPALLALAVPAALLLAAITTAALR